MCTSVSVSQEVRSDEVYSTIDRMFFKDEDAKDGKPSWHWMVKGRPVCRDVFLICYPIGSSTLYKLQERKELGKPYAHDKAAKSDKAADVGMVQHDLGALSVIGWYKYYSQQVTRGPPPASLDVCSHPRLCPDVWTAGGRLHAGRGATDCPMALPL